MVFIMKSTTQLGDNFIQLGILHISSGFEVYVRPCLKNRHTPNSDGEVENFPRQVDNFSVWSDATLLTFQFSHRVEGSNFYS